MKKVLLITVAFAVAMMIGSAYAQQQTPQQGNTSPMVNCPMMAQAGDSNSIPCPMMSQARPGCRMMGGQGMGMMRGMRGKGMQMNQATPPAAKQ